MLAIIPARGGSKGVPRKNIKRLGGKPLILWTIEAARASKKIDRIILSTDNEEIAEVCKNTGVDIPFMRPSNLAEDDSLAIDNYIYTIDRLVSDFNQKYEEFVVLQPTSPLRNEKDIDDAVDIFLKKGADSVISCVELEHPLDWVFSVSKSGKILQKEQEDSRKLLNRQDYDVAYIPNGAVSVFRFSLLNDRKTYYSDNTFASVMPPERSVDIDTEFDFLFAESLLSKRH